MGIFSKNPRISFPVNMSPKVFLIQAIMIMNPTLIIALFGNFSMSIYNASDC